MSIAFILFKFFRQFLLKSKYFSYLLLIKSLSILLRFSLRVENPNHRRGYAEEVYDVIVPRYPTDAAISS